MKKLSLIVLLVYALCLGGIAYGISEDQVFIFGDSIGDALIKKINEGGITYEKAQGIIDSGIGSYLTKINKNPNNKENLYNMMAFSIINDKLKEPIIDEIESKSVGGDPISYVSSDIVFHQDVGGTDERANVLIASNTETLITMRVKVTPNKKVSCPFLADNDRMLTDAKGVFYYKNNIEYRYNFRGTAPITEGEVIYCVYALDNAKKDDYIVGYIPTEDELLKSPKLRDLQEFQWSDSKVDVEVHKIAGWKNCLDTIIRTSTRDVPYNYCETRNAIVDEVLENDNNITKSGKKDYELVKVVDGDTIRVKDNNGKEIDVRMIGLDAPENSTTRFGYIECYGAESKVKLEEILRSHKIVTIETDETQDLYDSYGRLLGYVFINGNTNVNQLMIYYGYGWEYTYDKPYKYQSEFKQSQESAREGKRGLWNYAGCDGARKAVTTSNTNSSSSYSYSSRSSSLCGNHTWHRGPKGGCYYYNGNSKVYGDHSCCY